MTEPDPDPGSNINTAGGAYIEGGVYTGGGSFAGRDMNIYSRSQLEELRDYLEAAVARYAATQLQRVFKAKAKVAPDHPYKFLDWFDLEDTNNFYGRDDAVQRLHQLVLDQRLTVVHAKSGAGKTSLLNAGLAPRLIEAGRLPIFARSFQDPVLAVKRAIAPSTSERPWPELLSSLTLHDFLRIVCRYLPPGIERLVLLLDQFEEFFVFFPPRARRQSFIEDFAFVYVDDNLPVHTVISLRKDYYSDLAEFESYIPAVFTYQVRLEPLNPQQAAQAITAPAAKLARAVSYSSELLDILLEDLGSTDMDLPHLQIICTKLYEDVLATGTNSIDLPAYKRLGQASGILGNYLNDVLSRLPGRGETVAKAILKQLVSSEATKRTLPYTILRSRVDTEPAELDDTLTRLVNARLLRRDEVEDEINYEMAHEYLIAEIKQWLDTSDLAFKQVEELLSREVINWRIHHTFIPRDRLEMIYAQRVRLGRVDEETAECLLRSAIKSDFAIEEWLRLVGQSTLQPLLLVLTDSSLDSLNIDIRRTAAEVLGQLGDARATGPLIASLKNAIVRRAATAALVKLGGVVVEPLIFALKDADWDVRKAAATALGQLGDDRAAGPLILALKDSDWAVRKAAVTALGQLGDAAMDQLILALKDADWDGRLTAAEAMGQLGSARAVEPLIAVLKEVTGDLPAAAAEVLDNLNDARAAETLVAALKSSILRRAAAVALGKLGSAQALDSLIISLGDADLELRRAAATALGQLGGARAVEPLSTALKDAYGDVRKAAAEALGKLHDAQAMEPLIAALNDVDWDVRLEAAKALSQRGDAGAVDPLIVALKDVDWEVRSAAALALGQLRNDRAVVPLIARLQDEHWGVPAAAAEALGQLGDPRAVRSLILALGDADVRSAAVAALNAIGTPEALAALKKYER